MMIQYVLIVFCIQIVSSQFNASICGYIENNDLFYFINEARSDSNILQNSQFQTTS